MDPRLRQASPIVVIGMHRSGTRLLVKKYAADPGGGKVEEPARPAAKKIDAPMAAAAETDVSEEAGALPGWLDDSGGAGAAVKPVPETDMNIDVVEPASEAGDLTVQGLAIRKSDIAPHFG